MPGHYIKFYGVPDVFKVTGFEKIDLMTSAGKEQWSRREGWDTDAAMKKYPAQVRHGAIQMVFEPVKRRVVNIYYGANENPSLSNLARRPFKDSSGRQYKSVEHAYQSLKSGAFDKAAFEAGMTRAKAAGTLGTKTENDYNIRLMKKLIKESFEQNPEALKVLLDTGDALFTHTQDKGVWQTKFPELLMQVRDELRDAQDEGDKEPMKVVLPRTSPYTAKDQAKSDKATKFIGRGSAASSTAAYAKAWGARANSGAYEATDTVFVSVEGARTGRVALDATELQKALDAGATIITDDAANRGRSYNLGERGVATYLKAHGYEESAPGEWKPVDAQDKKVTHRKFNAMSTRIHQELGKSGISATHDSPIRHEGKFDWRKHQGKGEGAAAFGAGTYLSTSEGAHKAYKHKFSAQITKKALGAQYNREVTKSPTYHVTVNAKPEELLDWDAPLSEQSELVKKALLDDPLIADAVADIIDFKGAIKTEERSGEEIYNALRMKLDSQAKASDYLQAFGIVGHVYNASGGKNDKHRNYVIYDDSRIETNYVSFSQQKAGIDEMSPEQQTEVRTYVEKTLGPKVHVLFEKLGVSGEWTREDGEAYIRIALTALNPLSVAHHEAMHEFFQRLVDGADARTQKILLDAANSALVRRQLERKLSEAGEDAAVKQLDDPAERLAYMYQFWAAGELTVGPKTETLFQRAMNFLRNVVGVLSQSQKAELILEAFHTGKLAEPSAVAKLLDTVEAAENRYKEAAKVFKPVADLALRGAGTAYYTLERSGNPHLKKLASMFDTVVGEKTGEQSFFSARSQQTGIWLNRLENIVLAKGVTKEDLALTEKHLQENTVPKDAVARKLHNEIRKLLDDAHVYLREAGVKVLVDGEPDERGKPTKEWKPLGFKENYYPHVWSVDTLMELGQGDEFKQDLLKHHMKEMRTIAELATRDDPKNPVTPEDVAKGIVQRLLASQGVRDLQESSSELGFSPYMKAVNRRSLDFLDMEVFSKYLEKDMVKTLTSYLGQGVKRAEYSRKFKADGSVIKELMEKAETYEIEQLMKQHSKTPREKLVAQARAGMTGAAKAVMAMEGTLGYDINPQLRRFTGWVMMMQNYALLTMQIFSSQVDPVGIVVRGGTIKDAFDAYRRGVQEIVASIKNSKTKDDAARLAELLGTVDAGTYMDALGQTYSSVFMYGKAKHFSDKLFRYNGAEGWNRGMRIVATQAAISFIERHASKPDTHSKRWLEELYGDGAPVMKDGKLDTDAAANRLAIMRWVDGAILRPNAAHRPAWASDPHYALAFQLKQFTYSFQRTILARVHNELKHGNLSPLMSIAVGYMPVMLAADLAKALLKGVLGDEPAWVHGSLLDITSHTAQRAGLLGVGQFGVDAVKWGPAELAGPTAERMVQLIQAGAASGASP